MIDITRIMSPDNAVVSASNAIRAQEGPARFWSVGALLDCVHNSGEIDAPLPSCQTGACSSSRAQAMVRTAGEAVERLALHPSSALPGFDPSGTVNVSPVEITPWAGVEDRALRYFAESLSLGANPGARPVPWYQGRRLSTGDEVLVPAGLVDYPLPKPHSFGFDPGPSGAAAGTSTEAALKSALFEVLERDSVLVSWCRRLRTRSIDFDSLTTRATRDPHWERLQTTLSTARSGGLTPVFAEIPTSVPGVVCVVGGFRAELFTAPFICLGAKASDHIAKALLGACEESLQLWFGLKSDRLSGPTGDSPRIVTTDLERVQFLTSPAGRQAVKDWLDDPLPSVQLPHAAELDVDTLTSRLIEDGLDPIVVDLTDRLPRIATDQRWHVVKVIPVGYQPLRIDERSRFGWNRSRLMDAAERTNCPSRLAAGEIYQLPHPLP